MRKQIAICGALFSLFGVILIYSVLLKRAKTRKLYTVQAQMEIAQIYSGIQSYFTEYMDVPSGNSAAIIRALTGENQRHIVYLEFPSSRKAYDGSYLDRWGIPYRVTILPTEFRTDSEFQISSAGPDHVFGTGDDIVVTKKP